MKYPEVLYPTILAGVVRADTLRLESLTGPELFLGPGDLPPGGWIIRDDVFILNNFKPREINGHMYALTHQQKQAKSGSGWLKADPNCYHCWYTFRPQKKDDTGKWIPGSEIVKYFRLGDWRWDVTGTMIDGILQHWIGGAKRTTYINFSWHWD